jgi:hypothetical protein
MKEVTAAKFIIRGRKKVMSSIFISGTMVEITVKFAYIMDTQFKKLRLFLHKVSFIINLIICSLARDAVYRSHKILCCSFGAPNARCVSARRLLQNGVLGVHPSGDQNVEVGGC